MIDKSTHPDFDDDAISYFNNSVYSGDSEQIFKTDVYAMLCDYEARDKFLLYDGKMSSILNSGEKKIFYKKIFYVFTTNNKMNLKEMKEFIFVLDEYIKFKSIADKKLEIKKRINKIEKDFK